MKTCTKCGETKALEAFYACSGPKQSKSGRRPECAECSKAKSRAWLQTESGKAANRRKSRNNYKLHPDLWAKRQLVWRARNVEKRREISKRYSTKARSELGNAYVRLTLQIKKADGCSHELIEAKREHLRLVRLLKELKK